VSPRLPEQVSVQLLGEMPFEAYVARVVTGELGRAREPEALKAQAMAARSCAAWMYEHNGRGKSDKPFENSTNFQVAARIPLPHCTEAARATAGGLIVHRGHVVLAGYVSGAIWRPGAADGSDGRDDGAGGLALEKRVTYNEGKRGAEVKPHPTFQNRAEWNRGCMSQNGARELARQGFSWPRILRYFYGRDVGFTIPEPMDGEPPAPTPRPAPRPGVVEPPRPAPEVPGRRVEPQPPAEGRRGESPIPWLALAVGAYRLLSS
jgi:hypothetical protein